MSTTASTDLSSAIDGCRPEDVTPINLAAESLESTAPSYLLDLKRELADEGLVPARLTIESTFDDECPLRVQETADRVRGYVRAASFLGAGTVTVECKAVADEQLVRPALAACAERAQREGLQFDVHGPIEL
ncbi:hypothetical protein [Halovivax gelatinilyticus]|uniref:hypothetical protein n=1 Tax=Halovivax gelatinilyticus TaxID=2961597 RepID=UPI0020CA6713|nr:hypothetical protein [Halovivax gelatinilyticus]